MKSRVPAQREPAPGPARPGRLADRGADPAAPLRHAGVLATLGRARGAFRSSSRLEMADAVLRALATAGRMAPVARPARHNVEVLRDISYTDSRLRDHTLDIYRPVSQPGPWPVIMYVHGGGFSLLSKETHWIMGLCFARMGFIVFNISYRLAPRHPFPTPLEDTCAAYEWVNENAERFGGDLERLAVAGESAGANLITALSVATCYPRPEPFARRVYELGRVPKVALPACGILQVSDAGRFGRRRRLPTWVDAVLTNVSRAYLTGVPDGGHALADPLVILEEGEPPARPLPAFFAPVGTRDPLLDDTRRLERALRRLGVPCAARFFHRELHAFHALVWRESARRCWSETFGFLARHLDSPRASSGEAAHCAA